MAHAVYVMVATERGLRRRQEGARSDDDLAAPRIMRTDEPKEDYDGEAEARHGEQSE